MQAALLPDRGVVKVAGDTARGFLNGLITADMAKVAPGAARYGALLTPQGKIIVDFIVAEAPAADGGGFFLDVPKALAPALVSKLNFYKLRAQVICEDLSEVLGVMALWDGAADSEYGLCYGDPRLPALGMRCMLPPHLAAEAAQDLGARLADAEAFEAHRIALGVPRGGMDFIYGDTFPHEADMDQLAGVDFDKGCYVGQELTARMKHRGTARKRLLPVEFSLSGTRGTSLTAGGKEIGEIVSDYGRRGFAQVRLDRLSEVGTMMPHAGEQSVKLIKPSWLFA